METNGGLFFIVLIGGFFIYLAPAMLATYRHHRNHNAIYALNLLLGWTGVGWAAALIWALTDNTDKTEAAEPTADDWQKYI